MYIRCTDISDYSKKIVIITQKMDFGDLSKYVSFYKEDVKGVSAMCEAVKAYGDERTIRV